MRKANFIEEPGRFSTTNATTFVPPVILKVDGLVKIYGKRRVVDGVSFQVRKGEIVGLLGPNGAGKTTSFRMACGLINTNGGVVYLGSQDVTNWPMYRRSREGGMGYLPQDKSVFQKLSVQNNLLGVMEMLGVKRSVRKKRCDELLEKLHLTHLRYNYAGGLSGGERRRLEIARSLVSEPKIILLDEPFAAIDPITVEGIQEIIRKLAGDGISILITDHSVRYMLQIAERCYVIQSGQVLCHGTPEEVISNPEAKKVYFGENANAEDFKIASAMIFGNNSIDEVSDSFDDDKPETRPPHHSPVHKKHRTRLEDRTVTETIPSSQSPPESKNASKPVGRIVRQKPIASHDLTPPPMDEGAILQAERINRRQHAVNSETKSRRIGRRLNPDSLPERPIVHSNSPSSGTEETPTMPISVPKSPEEPAAGMSGVIRSLGSMIWKK